MMPHQQQQQLQQHHANYRTNAYNELAGFHHVQQPHHTHQPQYERQSNNPTAQLQLHLQMHDEFIDEDSFVISPSFYHSNKKPTDHSRSLISNSNTSNTLSINANSNNKNTNVTNIVQEILCEQDLSRAGNLFTLSNDILLNDFPVTIEILKSIIDNRNYINNLNQQSIVEIVLTKCISALRESKMINNYYDDLLDLLELCLKYNLNSSTRNSFRTSMISDYYDLDTQLISTNTPHANIVSDILSCILLDYLDPDLSIKAIPICIKLLQHHNCKRELLREISSYLSLIACRSPELLVDYVYYIVNAMLKGSHTGLAHLLYQICEANVECIYPLVKHLIRGLKIIESSNDLLNVLQIMYLVSLNHVQLVIVHLDDIIVFLADDICQDTILDILFSIASQTPIALEAYLPLFEKSSPFYDESYKVDKIIGTVGKSLRKKSEYCTNLLIQRIKKAINKSLKTNSLSKRLSYCLNEKSRLSQLLKDNSFTFQHDPNIPTHDYMNIITSRSEAPDSKPRDKSKDKIPVNFIKSNSYSYSNNRERETIDSQEDDLNKVTQYYEDTKRFIQLLTEIHEIVQVFPNVLNTYYKHICELFPHPSEDIAAILDRFKQLKSENSSICSKDDDLIEEEQSEKERDLDEDERHYEDNFKFDDNKSKPSLYDHSRDSIDNDLKSTDLSTNKDNFLILNSNETLDDDEKQIDQIIDKFENEFSFLNNDSHDLTQDHTEDEKDNSVENILDDKNEENKNSEKITNNNLINTKIEPIEIQTKPAEAEDKNECEKISNKIIKIYEENISIKIISEVNTFKQEKCASNLDKEHSEMSNSEQVEYSEISTSNRFIEETANFSLITTKINEEPEYEDEENQDNFPSEPNKYNNYNNEVNIKENKSSLNENLITEYLTSNSFLTELDKQMNQADHPISSTMRIQTDSALEKVDVVQRFFMKHMDKIKNYINNLNKVLPIPYKIEVEESSNTIKRSSLHRNSFNKSHGINDFLIKRFKSKRNTYLRFMCPKQTENYCLFSHNYFESPTIFPSTWIHIVFLSIQAKSSIPLRQQDKDYIDLKAVYDRLNEKIPFIALITSSFPSERQINELKEELNESRIFDLFEYKELPMENKDNKSTQQISDETFYMHRLIRNQWSCYLCANPDRFSDLHDEKPLIQGQLKEKHGKWKFLRRWHKRIFTLAGGSIVYFKKDMRQESLNVRYITEIQTLKPSSSKSSKGIPKAFEIFTDRNSFILKAQNSKEAEKWIQFLQLSKALENNRSKIKTSF